MSTPSAFEYTPEHVARMRDGMEAFVKDLGETYGKYKCEPAPGSPALLEEADPTFGDQARNAHTAGILALESCADHLFAFLDISTPPVATVASSTCVRGLIEAGSIAGWLLDSQIDVRERVARSYAYRYEGQQQQGRIGGGAYRSKTNQRVDDLERDALSLGFVRVENKDHERIGIAMIWPGITSLVASVLDEEHMYRLLSAVAHCHHWAVHQIGFRPIPNPVAGRAETFALEKHAHPNVTLLLGQKCMTTMTTVLLHTWSLFEWDRRELVALLEKSFDNIGLADQARAWR